MAAGEPGWGTEEPQRSLKTSNEKIAKIHGNLKGQVTSKVVLLSPRLQNKYKVLNLSPCSFLSHQNFSHVYEIPLFLRQEQLIFINSSIK